MGGAAPEVNVIGIVGWKNSGKTTLASALIREFSSRGLRVNSIKHAHHGVDVDQPGTDSYQHREAGAQEVILAGGQRFAIMHELRGAAEPTMDELLTRLGPCDWVVVEGFKSHSHPKIEVHRQASERAPLYPRTTASLPLPRTTLRISRAPFSTSMMLPELPTLSWPWKNLP